MTFVANAGAARALHAEHGVQRFFIASEHAWDAAGRAPRGRGHPRDRLTGSVRRPEKAYFSSNVLAKMLAIRRCGYPVDRECPANRTVQRQVSNMYMRRFFLRPLLGLCGAGRCGLQRPRPTCPRNIGLDIGPVADAPRQNWILADLVVNVPRTLAVSEAHGLKPRADIVWRRGWAGRPLFAQVEDIMRGGARTGAVLHEWRYSGAGGRRGHALSRPDRAGALHDRRPARDRIRLRRAPPPRPARSCPARNPWT